MKRFLVYSLFPYFLNSVRVRGAAEDAGKKRELETKEMRVFATLGACGALSVASMVSADFAGFYSAGWSGANYDGTTGAIGTTDYCVLDVYAQFDGQETFGPAVDQRVLSIFNANVEMDGGSAFVHNDIAGGNWMPNFSFDNPGAGSAPWVDSFVTIGGDPGPTNNTSADGNLDPQVTATLSENAGWFTGAPAAAQGLVDAQLRTFIGRFVVAYDASVIGETLNMTTNGSYNFGIGTGTFFMGETSGSWTIVPAPGALALLGLAGVVSRRRRA